MATPVALPLSVSLVICMFCRFRAWGRVRNLYPAKARTARSTRAAIRIGILRLCRGAIVCEALLPALDWAAAEILALGLALVLESCAAAIVPLMEPLMELTRPELVSRFRRFRSARISAALW